MAKKVNFHQISHIFILCKSKKSLLPNFFSKLKLRHVGSFCKTNEIERVRLLCWNFKFKIGIFGQKCLKMTKMCFFTQNSYLAAICPRFLVYIPIPNCILFHLTPKWWKKTTLLSCKVQKTIFAYLCPNKGSKYKFSPNFTHMNPVQNLIKLDVYFFRQIKAKTSWQFLKIV